MACTLLRIVQAAVSLRRRFECAIQSSFESVESGEVFGLGEGDASDEQGPSQPCERDLSTSEHLSRNFQLAFSEADESLEDPFDDSGDPFNMTFIRAEASTEEKENGAFTDAIASSSIDILIENGYNPVVTESGKDDVEMRENGGASARGETETNSPVLSPAQEGERTGAIQRKPIVQVNEVSGSDRSSDDSESSSDSRCSIKSVRLRTPDAVSPSSGCKPPKLIRSDDLETNAEKESNNLQWMIYVKESGSQLVEHNEGSSSTESDSQKEYIGYADWLLKGKESLGEEGEEGEEGDTTASDGSDDTTNEEPLPVEESDQDDLDSLLDDDDDQMMEASFEESFEDDGFVSLDVDEYDEDVIIEENEEDLERERLEEQMLEERRRFFAEMSGRGETAEHRKLTRQYSPAVYLTDPLPGIPESKVVQEKGEEPPAGGRLRHTSSHRSGRGSKRSVRSPPVQRQRCVQLEGGEGEEEGVRSPRPHPPSASDHRDVVLEVEPIRVSSEPSAGEVPVVVVATSEGGTRTHALHRLRGRSSQSSYSHSASGEPLPATHTYHKYGSSSFDLARSSGYEGARAAFHTTRSSFEGDRRLSLSARGACESLDKSPGSGRYLPSMDVGARLHGGDIERGPKEGHQRGGFRRSRSERVGGSSTSVSPARSESLRISRSRTRHQDVEMTEICSPRRLHSYKDYRIKPESTSSGPVGTSGTTSEVSFSARYSWRSSGLGGIRQSSLESGELEDLMENRRHVEQRRLLLQADSTTPSDEDEEPRSKVRYNDMGSLEQVNEEMVELLDDSSVGSSDTQEKIKVQCRALWQLRTTLEEEDPEEPEFDHGARMEVLSSPDLPSPGRTSDLENVTSATSHTTSFESNTEAIVGGEGGLVEATSASGVAGLGEEAEASAEGEVSHVTVNLPSSEARRTSYRAILANRLKHIDASARPPLSAENSFDSVDTECSSTTDLSRPEVLTTSFDSTTDCPTDSTSDTHSHRLQQMKADSGYRSLEANNGRAPKLSKKQIHFMEDSVEVTEVDLERDRSRERPRSNEESQNLPEESGDPQSNRERLRKSFAYYERHSSKSLTKKRREALRERHSSLDTDLSAALAGPLIGGSLDVESNTTDVISGKRSHLAHFLRTHRYPASHYRLLLRDYSIDEKSDRLFKEFSRTDVPPEWEPSTRRGSRLYTSRRLHRHLDAEGSPRSHRRKLSPQDSIEEEDQMAAALWEGEVSRPESLTGSLPSEDVPSFPVAEEVE